MKKLVIYIAGPYKGKNRRDVTDNLVTAQETIEEIYHRGAIGIFTPLMTDGFAGVFSEESMLERDLWLLEKCDAVYASLGWHNSEGAKQEINHANQLNIPVFERFDLLGEWLNAPSKSVQRRLACQLGVEK